MRQLTSSGFALVFIVGSLALLSVLGVTFFSVTSMEQRISRNYVHETEVRLLAESGVEYAIGRLQELHGGPITEEQFQMLGIAHPERLAFATPDNDRGRDFSMPVVRRGAFDATVELQVSDESAKLNINDSPRDADHPQNHKRLGRILAVLADEISGHIRGDYDGAALANYLMQDPATGRIAYPGDRFPGWSAVEKCLVSFGLSQEQASFFQRYLTLDSWRDEKVLRANLPLYGMNPESGDGQPAEDLVKAHPDRWLCLQTRTFELEARAPVNVNTAPVELLTALIQPLQGIFLKEGPCETQSSEHYGWWATGLGTPDERAREIGIVTLTQEFTPAMARRLAQAMHDRIHGTQSNADLSADQQDPLVLGNGDLTPNPFETWEEFRHFLRRGLTEEAQREIFLGAAPDAYTDDVAAQPWNGFVEPHTHVSSRQLRTNPPSGFSDRYSPQINTPAGTSTWEPGVAARWWEGYWMRRQQDLLCANFNPNSLLNDFNPNENIHLEIDKPQLTRNTTEFCFESTGVFLIRSTGALLQSESDATVARRRVTCAVRLFEILRQTTQADFLAGLQSDNDLSRYFSTASDYTGAWGALCSAHRSGLTRDRASLQAYPEPLFPGREENVTRANYDGSLMPATLECLTTSPQPLFYARFNGVRLDSICPPLALESWNYRSFIGEPDLQAHASAPNAIHAGPLAPDAADLDDHVTPGSVYPDGAYSEDRRVLAYKLRNLNRDGNHAGVSGSLSFWIKPNFHMGMCHRIRKFLSGPAAGGYFANQTAPVLYYMSNPLSDYLIRLGEASYSEPYKARLYAVMERKNWIQSRSLLFGWAWSNHDLQSGALSPQSWLDSFQMNFRVSEAVTRDFPPASDQSAAHTIKPQSEMRGHAWTHLSVAWNLPRVNSVTPATCEFSLRDAAWHANSPMAVTVYRSNALFVISGTSATLDNDWLRFGELPPPPESYADDRDYASPRSSPYHADSTFDEIRGARAAVLQSNDPMALHADLNKAGRYYRRAVAIDDNVPDGIGANIGMYTSPRLRLHRELGLAPGETLRLRSTAWTYYWPKNNRNIAGNFSGTIADTAVGVAVNPNDRRDPMVDTWGEDANLNGLGEAYAPYTRQWDPLSVDFRVMHAADIATPDWHFLSPESLGDGHDFEALPLFTYAGGSTIAARDAADPASITAGAGDEFQYCARFHFPYYRDHDYTYSTDPLKFVLHEAPVLDDITFTFWRGRPLVLRWMES